MASPADQSPSAFIKSQTSPFVLGSPSTAHVELSLKSNATGERADSMARPVDAREVLEVLKRENEGQDYRPRRGALLTRGLSLQSQYTQSTEEEAALVQKNTTAKRKFSSPSSSAASSSYSTAHSSRSSGQYNGDMYVNDNLTQQSLQSLHAVLNIPTNRSAQSTDRPGSPDSGYGNTPENAAAIKLGLLSPNSRSRSCSSEASSTADNGDRRASPGSGHWSGHENSALGLVAEEEAAGETSHHLSDIPIEDQQQLYHHAGDDILLHMPSRTARMATHPPRRSSQPLVEERPAATTAPNGSRKRGTWRKGRLRTHTGSRDVSLPGQEEKDYFQKTDELTKENAHFALSEALCTVIEEYKSNMREELFDEYLSTLSTASTISATSTLVGSVKSDHPDGDRSYDQEMLWQHTSPRRQRMQGSRRRSTEPSPLSPPQSPSPTSGRDVSLFRLMSHSNDLTSAEAVSRALLHHVGSVLGGGRQVEFRVPQVVQLPTEFISSIQRDQELQYSFTSSATPMRGNHEWAPPRQQLIHSIQIPDRSPIQPLVNQANRCAGCGMRMDPKQLKSYRFCHYMGKYFCLSCHHNSTCIIPAHVINKWSFKRFTVSDFARDTIAKIEKEPLFDVQSLNPELYEKSNELGKAKELRDQLLSMKKYILTCSRAESLHPLFEQLGHLITDIHQYSLHDFVQLKNGQLLRQLQTAVTQASRHIKSCMVCEGKGFVCELCHQKDIIFPFELQRVSSCPECHCCFHRDCHQEKLPCPRCERIKERRRQRVREIMVQDDVGESMDL